MILVKIMKCIKTQKNSKNCIICGMENSLGLKATFYEMEDDSVASVFSFRKEHQSYPERTHGGMISALLDEIMGRPLWIKEPASYAVTTTLNITYRRPVPYGATVKARGYITFDSTRGFSSKGEIYSMDGKLLAEGQARYLKVKTAHAFTSDFHEEAEMCYDMSFELNEIDFPEKKV